MPTKNDFQYRLKHFLGRADTPYILMFFISLLVIFLLGILVNNNFLFSGPNWLAKPTVRHGLLTGFLLLLTWLTAAFLIVQGEIIAKEWSKGLRNTGDFDENDAVFQQKIEVYIENFQGSVSEKQRIIE